MSDDASPSPIARPKRTAFEWAMLFFRTGWRPAASWVCVLILFVAGPVTQAMRLLHYTVEPLDWKYVVLFAAALTGLAGFRTAEKITGAAE